MNISIVTICFNVEKDIPKTIESVLNQNYQKIQYIIIDGNSSDHTVEVIKSFEPLAKERGVDFKWISEPDKGISDAFNKGIKLCTGEVIGLINAGDFYMPNVIQQVAREVDSSDVFYGNMLDHDENFKIFNKRHSDENAYKALLDCKMGNLYHPTIFLKNHCYKSVKFSLDKKFAMDYELLLTLYKKGKVFKYLDIDIASMYPYGVSERNYTSARLEVVASYKYHVNPSSVDINILKSYLAIFRTKIRSYFDKMGLSFLVHSYRKLKR